MSPQEIRRGYDPGDAEWFSAEQLAVLSRARDEIRWLLDRGYRQKQAADLVCNHYQLTARQRAALQRSTASAASVAARQQKCLPVSAAAGKNLAIDGFNLIITLETALSGGLLLTGDDGVIRDLATLRGSYRIIAQTENSVGLIGRLLTDLQVASAEIYLDQPVSNSGRLRALILNQSASWTPRVSVTLAANADTCLAGRENVVSGDSVVIDRCISWLNLTPELTAGIPGCRIVSLS